MRAKAIKPGFINGRYQAAGDVFQCSEDAFSARWMEQTSEPVTKEPAPEQETIGNAVGNIVSEDGKPRRRGRPPKAQ